MSTLAQLVTRVREKVDEATAAFWSDALIGNQLNESYRYYWAFILKLHEGYFAKTSYISFDATKTTGEYSLPVDFFKCRLVSRVLSNTFVPLKYFERYDTAMSSGLSNSTFSLPAYRFRGSYIVFEPAPDFTEANAVLLEYIRTLTPLGAGVDIDSEMPAFAEDCIVTRAVIKCKGIEEMVAGGGVDADPFIKDLLSTEQLLKEVVEQKSTARIYVEQFGEDNDTLIQNWA